MDSFWEIIVILLGIIVGMVSFFARVTHAKTEKTAADLASFKTHVATNHPTHDGINRRFDQVDEKLVKISDKVDEKFEKISDKVEDKFERIQAAIMSKINKDENHSAR